MFVPLLRAYEEGFRDVEIKTNNYEAYQVVKMFDQEIRSSVYDLALKIDNMVKNKS